LLVFKALHDGKFRLPAGEQSKSSHPGGSLPTARFRWRRGERSVTGSGSLSHIRDRPPSLLQGVPNPALFSPRISKDSFGGFVDFKGLQ
jgi:hypothetical protein